MSSSLIVLRAGTIQVPGLRRAGAALASAEPPAQPGSSAQVDGILECGDLSPHLPLWRLVAKAGPRSAARQSRTHSTATSRLPKSADKSAHSKVVAASPALGNPWSSLVKPSQTESGRREVEDKPNWSGWRSKRVQP